jgi:predicted 3-demethylubiquinone-9 3-methyltransferase (glyoxalase superfamily)
MKIKIPQKITPCLWFDRNAEQAVKFYVSLFKNSKIKHVQRYDKAGAEASGQPEGTVMTVSFQLAGQDFTALNGGAIFKFTEAISLVVNCKDQKEVNFYWKKMTSGGGRPSMCGWLKDKYGLSWQIVPTAALEMITDKDPAKSLRVMSALMRMRKIDLEQLRRAYSGD